LDAQSRVSIYHTFLPRKLTRAVMTGTVLVGRQDIRLLQ
jgi:hypothetical protein